MKAIKSELEIAVVEAYEMLKNREVHPSGTFDTGGRFYATNSNLINVRAPSRAYPYSQMVACRTLKYVKAVAEHFDCKTKGDILSHI